MSKCSCGFLGQCAADSEIPIRQGDTGNYSLLLTSAEKIDLVFCFFCGGRPVSETGPLCQCGGVVHWLNLPGSCVRQDTRFGEFQIQYEDNKLIMHFCPLCGGRFPTSKRSEFFLEPSKSEMVEFDRLLDSAKTLEDIVRILGEPDARFSRNEIDEKEKRVFGIKVINTTLHFIHVARTFQVCAQEDELGNLRVTFLKKPKT